MTLCNILLVHFNHLRPPRLLSRGILIYTSFDKIKGGQRFSTFGCFLLGYTLNSNVLQQFRVEKCGKSESMSVSLDVRCSTPVFARYNLQSSFGSKEEEKRSFREQTLLCFQHVSRCPLPLRFVVWFHQHDLSNGCCYQG